jgi:hypothetical protein
MTYCIAIKSKTGVVALVRHTHQQWFGRFNIEKNKDVSGKRKLVFHHVVGTAFYPR